MSQLDPNALRLKGHRVEVSVARVVRRRIDGDRFLKGPIPLSWLARAAKRPGRALHVGVALWFLAGLARSETVRLSSATLRTLGVDRHAARRALQLLEAEGLVSVVRRPGSNPVVTILRDGGASGQ